jgi:hypothetical protein
MLPRIHPMRLRIANRRVLKSADAQRNQQAQGYCAFHNLFAQAVFLQNKAIKRHLLRPKGRETVVVNPNSHN